jgi:hypothetical protein
MQAVFPAEVLDQVAMVILARRPRRLSSETGRSLGAKTAYNVTSQTK